MFRPLFASIPFSAGNLHHNLNSVKRTQAEIKPSASQQAMKKHQRLCSIQNYVREGSPHCSTIASTGATRCAKGTQGC